VDKKEVRRYAGSMKLPFLLSVPHAGLTIPPEIGELCALTAEDIVADSDEDAAEIYDLEPEVTAFVLCPVARPVVDVNRPAEDRGQDGAFKLITRTPRQPVYHQPPHPAIFDRLRETYHQPYHARLRDSANGVRIGIDCHTMAARRPRADPDKVSERPAICLSNAGCTCPDQLLYAFQRCLEEEFGHLVSLNKPFRGGHTIRSHAPELPWLQIEISRAPFASPTLKRERFLSALRRLASGLSGLA
jgi:N-formylglutamate deformylase